MRKNGILSSFIIVLFGFLVVSLTCAANATAGDVVIVGNKNVAVSSINKDMLKAIFNGSKTTWDDGSKIDFFVLVKGSDVHKSFLKGFLNTSPSQFERYWRKQVFTGTGSLPKAFNSESDLLSHVAANDGAIGYVSASVDTGSVKVITVK